MYIIIPELSLTIDDGKICNYLTKMLEYYLCVPTSKTINDIRLRLKVLEINQYACIYLTFECESACCIDWSLC